MPGVPDTHTSVCTSSDKLRGSILHSVSSNAIDLVSHVGVRLHSVLFNSPLDVVNDKLSFVVDSGNVAHTYRGSLESAALDSEFFLPTAKEFELATIKLVNVENTFGRRALAKETEASALRNPLHVEGCEGERLVGMLNNLRRIRRVHLNF